MNGDFYVAARRIMSVETCLLADTYLEDLVQNKLEGGEHPMRDTCFTIRELQRERKTFKTCHDEVIRHDEPCVPSSLQEDTRKTSRTTNSKVTAALADFG